MVFGPVPAVGWLGLGLAGFGWVESGRGRGGRGRWWSGEERLAGWLAVGSGRARSGWEAGWVAGLVAVAEMNSSRVGKCLGRA